MLTSKSGGSDGVNPYGYGNSRSAYATTITGSPTFTFTFTWQPAAGNPTEQPPDKVVAIKSCYAFGKIYGIIGSVSVGNGLGSPSVDVSEPSSKAFVSDGSKGEVKSGGSTVTVTVSPTATVSSPNSAIYYVFSVSASISTAVPVILRDGVAITDANNQCLPGEAINLSVSGGDPGTNYSWSITGEHFKNFTPSTPSVYEDAGAVVKNQQTITYRYLKGGVGGLMRDVTCTVKVAGVSTQAEDKLKVFQPTSIFSLRIGGDASDLTGVVLTPALNDQGTYGYGMDWKGSTVTVSYGSGKFGFAQTGNVSRTVYDGTVGYKLPASGATGLDFGFPYGGYDKPVGTVVGSDSTNGAGDTPGDTFTRDVKNSTSDTTSTRVAGSRLVIADSFTTWLMFKSSNANSSWVPLRKSAWNWGSDAYRATPKSAPTNGAGGNGSEASDFPSWTNSININQPYVKMTP